MKTVPFLFLELTLLNTAFMLPALLKTGQITFRKVESKGKVPATGAVPLQENAEIH